jgi:hypothetical protein
MITERQIVNFKKGVIISLKVLVTDSKIVVYLYPLSNLPPFSDVEFFSYFPDNWMEDVLQSNNAVYSDSLNEFCSIEKCYVRKYFQGLILGLRLTENLDEIPGFYFMPLSRKHSLDSDFLDGIKVSDISLSLNFSPNDNQKLNVFVRDSIFVSLILTAISYFKKIGTLIIIVKSYSKCKEVYEDILTKFISNRTVFPKDFVYQRVDNETNKQLVMFAKDDEMKSRLEYFQSVNISENFIPQLQKDFPLEEEINKLQLGLNKKIWSLPRSRDINAWGTTNEQIQFVNLYSTNPKKRNVVILIKHPTLEEAEEYMVTTLQKMLPTLVITNLDNLDSSLLQSKNVILNKKSYYYTLTPVKEMKEYYY